jgi:hypothetical protein
VPIHKEFTPFGTSKTSFGSLAPIGKEFKPIRTGKTSFKSQAPIGKEFTPIRTRKTSLGSLAPIGNKFTPIGTCKTGFISLASIGKEFTPRRSRYNRFQRRRHLQPTKEYVHSFKPHSMILTSPFILLNIHQGTHSSFTSTSGARGATYILLKAHSQNAHCVLAFEIISKTKLKKDEVAPPVG